MPLNIDIMQILLHMLNFVILTGGLTLLLFKPICKFLNDRNEYYEKLDAQNSEKAAENEKLKAEYEQMLSKAENELAERKIALEKEMADSAKVYIDEAKAKATAIIAEAEKDAEKRKLHIMESSQPEIRELVMEATQKLLCDSVSEEHTHALFDEFIKNADQFEPDKRTSK